ncbi:MAG TPA: hypothetical protein VFZ65_21960 [Planctomycetota bacterium]|nr:hypothetical protein [Planctomycetota bacterium]
MPHLDRFAALAAVLPLVSCYQFQMHAQAGYAQMKVDGEAGYLTTGTSPATSGSIRQDFESAFGIGDDQGAPYARVSADMGVPVIAVSGFLFDEQGTGTLQAQFGNLSAGVDVRSKLDFANVKASYALKIPIGPVSIAPGIAVDYFDFELDVQDTAGLLRENVQLQAPIPLAFVRGQLDLSVFTVLGEVGYVEVDTGDVQGSLLDIEAMAQWHANAWIDVFVGYRALHLDADGTIDNDTFDTTITVSGFLVGGGFTF